MAAAAELQVDVGGEGQVVAHAEIDGGGKDVLAERDEEVCQGEQESSHQEEQEGIRDSAAMTRLRNQTIISEHEIRLNDVPLRESKEICTQTTMSGQRVMSKTTYTRVIGERLHQTVEEMATATAEVKRTVNTTMSQQELEVFEGDWQMLWRPGISDETLLDAEQLALRPPQNAS